MATKQATASALESVELQRDHVRICGEAVRVNRWPPLQLQLSTAVCMCCARWRSSAATAPRPAGRSDRCGSTVRKQKTTFQCELELKWSYRRNELIKCTVHINNRSMEKIRWVHNCKEHRSKRGPTGKGSTVSGFIKILKEREKRTAAGQSALNQNGYSIQ